MRSRLDGKRGEPALSHVARWDMTHATLLRLRMQCLSEWAMVSEHMVCHACHARKTTASAATVLELVPARLLRPDLTMHRHDAHQLSHTAVELVQSRTHAHA